MMANYDVAFKTMTDDGTTKINETKYIIGDGISTTNEYTNWLGWLFLGMGLYSSVMFFVEILGLVNRES